MKKWLLILLAALLLFALLPSAAFADPPKGTTHLHNWVVTGNQKATCTEKGKKTWKCSLCGETYTETYPALGHDWDEGKVTAVPHGFTPGERTYTCRRDASHTRTEEVGGLAVVFEWLHGVDFSSIATYSAPLTRAARTRASRCT